MSRKEMIEKIRTFPPRLEAQVAGLSAEQLTTHYVPNEWSIAQNIHHLADVHLLVFYRFKIILLQDAAPVPAVLVNEFAETVEAVHADVQSSLEIIRGIHARWALLMDNMSEEQWQRVGIHATRGELALSGMLETYSRHCDSHTKQIQDVLDAMAAQA